MRISNIEARSIDSSRARPTIEVILRAENLEAIASVPSGKSTGKKEAYEKRDSDGGGVEDAIAGINGEIKEALLNRDFISTDEIDQLLIDLDGTQNKSNLGANALLAISIAATRLFAEEADKPLWKYIAEINGFTPGLPKLYANVLEGGVHADWALPFQEYILVPKNLSIEDGYAKISEWIEKIGANLKERFGQSVLADEGGYAAKFQGLYEPFAFLKEIAGDEADIAIDAAASEFYKDGKYKLLEKDYSAEDLLEVYSKLVSDFQVFSIEDPFVEDGAIDFSKMTEKLGDEILVIGDDLTSTNPEILQKMIEKEAGNALIIKPNQIGTLKEVYETVELAHKAGWKCVASHRSGETEDDFIADLAVAIGAFGIKAGSPTQEERRTKYERLIKIEEELG